MHAASRLACRSGEAPDASTITPSIKKTLDEIVNNDIGWQATIQVLYGELDTLDPKYLANPLLAHVVPADLIQWYGTTEGQHRRNGIASWLLKLPASATPEATLKAGQDFYAPLLTRNRNVTAYLAQQDARFLFGSDTVAPSSPEKYFAVYELYEPLWSALTPEASQKVRIGNYERIFDEGRRRVRAWEKANVK